MHYEINVSLNGKHLFATHERSATSAYEAEKLVELFADRFPHANGYDVSVTFIPGIGYSTKLDANEKRTSAQIIADVTKF